MSDDESLIGPLTPSPRRKAAQKPLENPEVQEAPAPKAPDPPPFKPLATDNGRHPGPWNVDDRGIVKADPRPGTVSEVAGCVASVYSPYNTVGIANGKLIAASPDLLVACEKLLAIPGIETEAPEAVKLAKAAVAKAKGGAA